MKEAHLGVKWFDGGREPQMPSNPKYPDGIDIDASGGAAESCFTKLDYPAPRCGHFLVVCHKCGLRVMLTTAGRADDPRSVRLACKRKPH